MRADAESGTAGPLRICDSHASGTRTMTTTTTTLNVGEVAEFWRIARRLYAVYNELDRTFELGVAPCADLDDPMDRQGG